MLRWPAVGFLAAGLMNIVGVLLFSRGLTDDHIGELYPEVFGRCGLICIMLWGLAYIAVARRHEAVPLLLLVFAVEKAVYTATWFIWINEHGGSWIDIWKVDPLTAVFYAIYGPNDLLFGLFFAWRWVATRRS